MCEQRIREYLDCKEEVVRHISQAILGSYALVGEGRMNHSVYESYIERLSQCLACVGALEIKGKRNENKSE